MRLKMASAMREIIALAALFAPLSLLSFGGGSSILAPIQAATVDQYGWLTRREFVDYFAISRASPGPGSMLVVLIGWKVAGWAGAIVSTVAIYLPASVLCFSAARIWNKYRGTAVHTALERGLVPIGTGLAVAGAVIVLRTSDAGLMGWLIAAAATTLLVWRNVFPLIVLAGGGVIYAMLAPLVV